MNKKFTGILLCTLLLSGCPEAPVSGAPGGHPPQSIVIIQDSGPESESFEDAGTATPISDAGSNTPSLNDAGQNLTHTDGGDTNPITTDGGHNHLSSNDAGTATTIMVDAGSDAAGLLQGDAGLLNIPTLSQDGGSFTPDAFLYIRNISIPSGGDGFVEVMINNDEPLGGLQFMISGVTPIAGSTSGGLIASTNGFTGTITANGQFLAFTMTIDTLPVHNGTLTQIPISAISGTQICITDVIVSDSTGTQLLSYSECKDAP